MKYFRVGISKSLPSSKKRRSGDRASHVFYLGRRKNITSWSVEEYSIGMSVFVSFIIVF